LSGGRFLADDDMLLIHGAYHFWPKVVAFRNDFCLTCQAPTRSIAVRTFDVGHIFWVPILPVGLWKHWRCAKCAQEPHTSPTTRPFFKWAGLCILVLLSITFWAAPLETSDVWISWLFRLGAPAASVGLVWHLLRAPKRASLRQAMKSVGPANDAICPFCQTPLMAGARWFCPGCGVTRY
jgi:hypothetical protein